MSLQLLNNVNKQDFILILYGFTKSFFTQKQVISILFCENNKLLNYMLASL